MRFNWDWDCVCDMWTGNDWSYKLAIILAMPIGSLIYLFCAIWNEWKFFIAITIGAFLVVALWRIGDIKPAQITIYQPKTTVREVYAGLPPIDGMGMKR
jgi:hypothetical protein